MSAVEVKAGHGYLESVLGRGPLGLAPRLFDYRRLRALPPLSMDFLINEKPVTLAKYDGEVAQELSRFPGYDPTIAGIMKVFPDLAGAGVPSPPDVAWATAAHRASNGDGWTYEFRGSPIEWLELSSWIDVSAGPLADLLEWLDLHGAEAPAVLAPSIAEWTRGVLVAADMIDGLARGDAGAARRSRDAASHLARAAEMLRSVNAEFGKRYEEALRVHHTAGGTVS